MAELLEARRLLSFEWTPEEVYLLELVNRARSDPMAEGARLGIDLTAGLTPGELARLGPQEPLALNEALTVSSRLHSQDMADRGYFDHIDPDGLNPTERANAQGYYYSAGENIAAGFETVDDAHAAWLESLGHRLNVLSLYEDFDTEFHYDEFGAGIHVSDGTAPYPVYYTQTFGYQGLAPDLFLLGVVYDDVDSNGFYGMTEGVGGVLVEAIDGSGGVVGSYLTAGAGNYQFAIGAGTYTLRFTRESDGATTSRSVTADSVNVKTDVLAADLVVPPANLRVTDILFDDATGSPALEAGQALRLDFDVVNEGWAGTPAGVRVDWYWGASEGSTANAIEYGLAAIDDGLTRDESERVTDFEWIVPDLGPGTYWLTAVIDSTGAVTETNEGDNSLSQSFTVLPPADLRVTDILMAGVTAPPAVQSGQRVRLDVDTINEGSSGTHAPVRVAWYWGTSEGSTAHQIHDGTVGAGDGLAAGESDRVTDAEWSIPDLAPGTYWLTAVIDPGATVAESDETDNARSESFTVVAPPDDLAPDLRPYAVLIDGSAASPGVRFGQGVRLDFDITNEGDAATSADIRVEWYWGASEGSTANFIGYSFVGAVDGLVPAEAERATQLVWSIPDLEPGTYWVTVAADSSNRAIESDESDNFLSMSFTVLPRDQGGDPGPALVGSVVFGGSVPGGPGERFTVATMAPGDGGLVYQQRSDGSWQEIDLRAVTGAGAILGPVVIWTDAIDGLVYGASTTEEGVLLFTRSGSDAWSVVDITASIVGSEAIVGSITQFTTIDGVAYVAGLNSVGELVMYSRTGADHAWEFSNVVRDQLEPQGQTMPVLVSALTSYVTGWNGLNIAAVDQAGHIQAIWWAPGMDYWRADDLSALTGAPTIVGSLTPYVTPWGGINLAGTDASGHVVVTWWAPDRIDLPNAGWATSDLTELFGGPAITGSDLASYVTPWGGLNVTGLTGDGALVVYWWSPGMDEWLITALTDYIDGAPLPVDAVRGFTSPGGTINIVSTTAEGHVVRYWWSPLTVWVADDLTELAA